MLAKKFFAFLIPVLQPSLIMLPSCPMRGASRGVRKWGRARAGRRGNPKVDAAPGDVPRKHALGRPWVSVRPVIGSATEAGWTGTGERREIAVLRPQGRQVPGRTDQGLKDAATERRKALPWPLFPGDPGNKLRSLHYKVRLSALRLPSFLRGRKRQKPNSRGGARTQNCVR